MTKAATKSESKKIFTGDVRDIPFIEPVFSFGDRVVSFEDGSLTGTVTGMVYRYCAVPKATYGWWEYIVLWDYQSGLELRVNVGSSDIGFETSDTLVLIER